MKGIFITDKIYKQLESMAIEQDQDIDIVACMYLQRGMGELDRLEKRADEFKATAEMSEAMFESKLDNRRH
jgi:hypothetical protein